MNISVKQSNILNTDINVFSLSGEISEESDFTQSMTQLMPYPVSIVDLRDVERINSHGSRLWIKWIEALSKQSKVFLYECSPVVVREMIRVSNFADNSDIISLRFPFICTQGCGEPNLISIKPHLDDIKETERCATCDRKLVFDGISAPYYTFLKRVGSTPPNHGADLIRNIDRSLSTKEVEKKRKVNSPVAILPDAVDLQKENGQEFLSEVGSTGAKSAVGGLKSVVFDHSSAFDFHTDINHDDKAISDQKLIYISAALFALSLFLLIFILLK